jgi:hypothetical protein
LNRGKIQHLLALSTSLTATLDTLNSAFFLGEALDAAQRREAALYIASWQGKPGAYHSMFGMPATDFAQPLRLFTGEIVTSGASKCHIVGEEACRVLLLLAVDDPIVTAALRAAQAGLGKCLVSHTEKGGSYGTFCCGTCSVAFWRHLTAGGMDDQPHRLQEGVKVLSQYHLPNGQWRRFPFYYTLSALVEMDPATARPELRHAAPACERALGHIRIEEPYHSRRRLLLERALALV